MIIVLAGFLKSRYFEQEVYLQIRFVEFLHLQCRNWVFINLNKFDVTSQFFLLL